MLSPMRNSGSLRGLGGVEVGGVTLPGDDQFDHALLCLKELDGVVVMETVHGTAVDSDNLVIDLQFSIPARIDLK